MTRLKSKYDLRQINWNLLYSNFLIKGAYSGLLIGILIFFGGETSAQSTEVITLKSKTSNTGDEQNITAPKEEKTIEFVIIGMTVEHDKIAAEELLVNEKGIDRARLSAVNNHCTVITLQGYSVDELYIKNLLESKGLSMRNYVEKWINKPYTSPGDKVYIQE